MRPLLLLSVLLAVLLALLSSHPLAVLSSDMAQLETTTVTPTPSATPTALSVTPDAPLTVTLTATPTPSPSSTPADHHVYLPYVEHIAPGAPGSLSLWLDAAYMSRVYAVWTPADRALFYWVQRSTDPDFRNAEILAVVSPGLTLEYVGLPVPPNQRYYYAVAAVNAWGLTRSNAVSVLFEITPTPTPSPTPFNEISGQLRSDCCTFVQGVTVQLARVEGGRMTIVAETVTSSTSVHVEQGRFFFQNLPPLAPGQYYQVVFPNAERRPDLVSLWYGMRLPEPGRSGGGGLGYTIGNVYLDEPAPNAALRLPVTFTGHIPSIYGRGYRVLIREVGPNPRGWITGDVVPRGDGGFGITLDRLASGMEYGREYEWTFLINYNAYAQIEDDYGFAFETRRITFRR